MTTRRVLVIAVDGQASDGGLAPALLTRLRSMPVAERWWLTLISDAQLQIEHALDLQISDLAIFVDASTETDAPGTTGMDDAAVSGTASPGHETVSFRFQSVEKPPGHRISLMDSTLSPSDVLHTLSTIGRRETLPKCFQLSLRVTQSQSGTDATVETAALESASDFLQTLLQDPDPDLWEQRLTSDA